MEMLAEKKCVPCRGGVEPLDRDQQQERLRQLEPGWEVVNGHHLEKEFTFGDFQQALRFVNRVGEIAEQEQHHPDIYLGYNKVRVQLWTHKIDGLHENDFIVAAKIDRL